jgi:hypothetical protein
MAKFEAGQSGNPSGRPKGARSRLSEDFLAKLYEDFAANGQAAIETTRVERPHEYLKIVASIIPKEVTGEEGGPIVVTWLPPQS